jgi:hypothetical protein
MTRSRRLSALTLVLVVAAAAAGAGRAVDSLPVWGTVPSPNRGELENALLGISIVSSDDVWAVGEYNSGVPPTATGRRTLVEHWNGNEWRLVDSPNPVWEGLDLAKLEAVDAVSPSFVWAVGHADDFGSLRSTTLIERWDGTRWRIVRSPNPAGADQPNALYDVVALGPGPGEALAVGGTGFPARALTLRWNGRRWRNVANSCGVALRGVTAVSPTEVWAVGDNTICRYDGVRWTVVPSAQPRPGFNEIYQLDGISAAASDDVWAVGSRGFPRGEHVDHQSFAEHWDGTQWTAFFALEGVAMSDVQALARTDAWSVGTHGAGPLILHWDGSSWGAVPTPPANRSGRLNAIDAFGSTVLWAAGAFFDREFNQRTLIEQAPSTSQGQIVGDTNVAFATVSWFGPASGSTETNAFGEYAAPGLPAGTYTVVVALPGCDPASATVEVVAGATTSQDFQVNC